MHRYPATLHAYTRYAKVGFDFATLRIAVDDHTFAVKTDTELGQMDFGSAKDCKGAYSKTGAAVIDLRGTPYAVSNPTQPGVLLNCDTGPLSEGSGTTEERSCGQWTFKSGEGWNARLSVVCTDSNQMCFVRCGGHCGQCSVQYDALQLERLYPCGQWVQPNASDVCKAELSEDCNNRGTLAIDGCSCDAPWIGGSCGIHGRAMLIAFIGIFLLIGTRYAYTRHLRPYLTKRRFELKIGLLHPIVVKTLAGDVYTLEGWGRCPDLKAALHKLAPGSIGVPATFELLGPLADYRGDDGNLAEIDPAYGSDDRTQMMASRLGKMKMNDEGNAVAPGTSFSGYKDTFYCGQRRRIPGTDGRCGPSNGTACPSCVRYKTAAQPSSQAHFVQDHELSAGNVVSEDHPRNDPDPDPAVGKPFTFTLVYKVASAGGHD